MGGHPDDDKVLGCFHSNLYLFLFIDCLVITVVAIAIAAWQYFFWPGWITVVLSLVVGIAGMYGSLKRHDLAIFICLVGSIILLVWYIVQLIISIIVHDWIALVWSIAGVIAVIIVGFLAWQVRGKKFDLP